MIFLIDSNEHEILVYQAVPKDEQLNNYFKGTLLGTIKKPLPPIVRLALQELTKGALQL